MIFLATDIPTEFVIGGFAGLAAAIAVMWAALGKDHRDIKLDNRALKKAAADCEQDRAQLHELQAQTDRKVAVLETRMKLCPQPDCPVKAFKLGS